jgi:hypothetical protein
MAPEHKESGQHARRTRAPTRDPRLAIAKLHPFHRLTQKCANHGYRPARACRDEAVGTGWLPQYLTTPENHMGNGR